MELRRYWAIIWRYRWLVLVLPFLVGLGSTALWIQQPNSYSTEMRAQLVLVPPQATAPGDYFRYDSYYNYLATEYAVDDLVEVVNGNRFADAVTDTLHTPAYNVAIDYKEVRGAFKARRIHRVLVIDIGASTPDRTLAIGRAISATLDRDPIKYFTKGDLAPRQGAATLVVEAPYDAKSDRVRRALNVVLQTLVALFAGLGLAFLFNYLNQRLRDADSTSEALGLPIIGQIPNGRTFRERGRS